MQLKIDLHVHSEYSVDSLITAKELVFFARKRGLDGVAVTDHDRLDGAVKISREVGILVVTGMEITSAEGHIMGLNLRDPVPQGLSADETIDRIHDSGGLAIACHPAALLKESLGENTTSRFDAIEVINSAAFPFAYCVARSERMAARLHLPRVAGSDAHYGPEVGCAYTLIDAEPNVDKIADAIRKGKCQPFGKAIPLTVRMRREISVLLMKSRHGREKVETLKTRAEKDGPQMMGRSCGRN